MPPSCLWPRAPGRRAIEACSLIQADLDSLTADMQDLKNQVGPTVELAEERHRREQAGQLLFKRWHDLNTK